MAATAGIVEVGPWGGVDGSAWKFRLNVGLERLTKITIHSIKTERVYSIQFTYVDVNDISRESQSPVFGGPGGDAAGISLADNEIITGISGTFANIDYPHITITSLSFTTNLDKYGPYGNPEEGTNFSLPVCGGSFVGYFGKCGDRLDSIGVMLKCGE